MPVRYPIDAIQRLNPPAPVALGGRVLQVERDSVLVRDVTGAVRLRCVGPRPELGAWVRCEGTWNGIDVEGRFETLNVPRVPFPKPGGDWAAFQGSGRAHRLRLRSQAKKAIGKFFDSRAFIEVDTPAMVPSPGLDVHLDAFEVGTRQGEAPRWLITSPEYQMKRVLAGGLPRIYQLARCFRRDEQGSWHQPEFTMLEWYRAFAGSAEVMRDTEELVANVATTLGGSATLVVRGARIDATPPWERLRVDEAFERYAGIRVTDVLPDEERFFRILIEQIEPKLGRERPVFLTHWPASMASLARLVPDEPACADRFEAYVGGIELCNGFGELIDPVEQRARLVRDQQARVQAGRPAYPIDECFLGALEEGLPPCGGNALGFDRLLMLVLGVDDIDEVLAISAERL